ncbi:extracellular solute-binding protein [Paenibacillus sp. sgz302251]|uniref:extracellular solute-binding protein n=1 Tax=Paenibacillus sp. sgz302251 TaxID=3414493 RepID=UPI003C7A7EE1
MTSKKYVPFIIGVLLLTALLLIPFSKHTNPTNHRQPDDNTTIQPAQGELIIDQLSEIHVNVSLPAAEFELLTERNRHFMMKYPHIDVQLTNEPSTDKAYAEWTLQSRQGEAADVMLLDNDWVKPFAVSGFLQAVDSIMTGDVLSDQMIGLLELLKWNGYIWGVPKDVNPYVVAWSSNLLEQSGFQTAPAEWTAYQAVANQAIASNPQVTIVQLSEDNLKQQLVWLATFQTEQTSLINLKAYNNLQMDQLQWLRTMEQHVGRQKLEDVQAIAESILENRLLAAVIPWAVYENLSESIRSELIVDRNRTFYPWLNGRSYVISSGTEAEEEAMLWIQEVTDIYEQQKNYDLFNLLPVRASLYALNRDIQIVQARMPPAWWERLLNVKQPPEQLPLPDPLWPEKWKLKKEETALIYSD